MELTLTPELEQRLERKLSGGRWHSAAEVIETALDMLDDLDDGLMLNRKELDASIQEGIDSAERGELYSEEEVRAHLAALRVELQR